MSGKLSESESWRKPEPGVKLGSATSFLSSLMSMNSRLNCDFKLSFDRLAACVALCSGGLSGDEVSEGDVVAVVAVVTVAEPSLSASINVSTVPVVSS